MKVEIIEYEGRPYIIAKIMSKLHLKVNKNTNSNYAHEVDVKK